MLISVDLRPLVIVPICVAATASMIGSRRLLKRVCVNRRSPVFRIPAFHAGLISSGRRLDIADPLAGRTSFLPCT